MDKADRVLRVAVPAPVYGCFDYLPPPEVIASELLPGVRLRVPFGRRRLVGVLLESAEDSAVAGGKLRPALELLDSAPIVDKNLLYLCRWAADYYHYPVGEVFASALPAALRQGKPAQVQSPRYWRITAAGEEVDAGELGRAHRQHTVLEALAAAPDGCSEARLRERVSGLPAVLRSLSQKGWVEMTGAPTESPQRPEAGPPLNEEQRQAADALKAGLEGFRTFLIEGVTGSGKTEVYLSTVAKVLASGAQALVLVPEIGLTPQLLTRFTRRLGRKPVVLHSGLSDAERLAGWQQARAGEAGVVIGTRSAVFTPFDRLGLIVVDESHDSSLKQQDGFRYSARDLAVQRARIEGVPIVLGSATPSLESLHNAESGRFDHLRLHRRAGAGRPPELKILDIRSRPLQEGLSQPLLAAMRRHIDAEGQVLLFLNRRGFAPTVLCHDCGWSAACRRCDSRLTLHRRSGRLRCHHCGAERPAPEACPECEGGELLKLGEGTERLDDALAELFPDVPRVRIDRDTTTAKGRLEDLLETAASGAAQILIGTQMLAKGHDFPRLSLVGIVNADQGLYSADFRAAERMAQLIMQVSGRAGRAERAGEVLIQTHNPGHPLINSLVEGGYRAFADAALALRREGGFPPFGYLALLRAEATDQSAPGRFLEQAAEQARRLAVPGVDIWGPAPAPMERRAGRWRSQLLLKSASRPRLHKLLGPLVPGLAKLPSARRVRWSVDVDPQDLF